ncbi:Arrestin (or S-antigen), C-terminal domain [Teratosphaeria destructans]|uniref:Arrestin (Or S-antigen), C-terminal domain n=1 Tax=Teratosphaeria destructans TaxID=418781 RepID=A0A9W7SZG4_9PEZI|nr:Arrestin (or S-antigen), C-terminal domain [Teratosphaeria destructans]
MATSASRPLSDIREITEPSLMDLVVRRQSRNIRARRSQSRGRSSPQRHSSSSRKAETARHYGSAKSKNAHILEQEYPIAATSSSYSATPPEHHGAYAIPQSSVPRRSSSFSKIERPMLPPKGHTRKPSIRLLPTPPPLPPAPALSIPNRGQSRSPVKEARLRLDPITSDTARRVPSRTLVRNPQPTEILEFPSYKHPRLKLDLQASAPVFVGGGSIEGFVKVTVDGNERSRQRRTLGLGSLAVDVIGFEDVSGGRRATFLALGTELVDAQHPPSASMMEPSNLLTPGDKFWTLSPSVSALPFMISLPLDTGPPPFQSKQANIRFMLCATALIRDAGNHYRVRTSQEVQVLPTYDPEKALTSLPSPLTAADELRMPRTSITESVKVTAGLHRQVWVSGSTIFVDVHIVNKSRKAVKRLDLSLERDILLYKHSVATTRENSADHARVFESNHQSMAAITSLKSGTNGWNGVDAHSSATRTCDLELPKGHATIRCGKYFEVRYFLNVTVAISNTKLVSLQLPIILIHMNSLDVVPNSVAQVAAAIQERRYRRERHKGQESSEYTKPSTTKSRHHRGRSLSSPAQTGTAAYASAVHRKPSYTQGRAFAAPRQQSLDRARAERADLDNLRQAVDSSPRKHAPQLQGFALRKMASNISIGNMSLGGRSCGNNYEGALRVLGFRTPEEKKKRDLREPASGAEGVDSIRERMRRMRSFESVGSKRSPSTPQSLAVAGFGPWHENVRPCRARHQIDPHLLGMAGATSEGSRAPKFHQGAGLVADGPTIRPGAPQVFRGRPLESEGVVGVARRPSRSHSIKDRGVQLWEQVRVRGRERDGTMEGWI